MKFKDLKVGDKLYVINPIYWHKPIKKTIDKIVPFGADGKQLAFFVENDGFLGAAMPELSQSGVGNVIFADFAAVKQYWIDSQKNIIKNLNDEIDRLKAQISLANDNLEMINEMQDED